MQIRTSCLWTMIDRTGPSESGLLCCCITPQLLFSTLGFMSRVGHKRDSGRAGGRSQAVVLITPGFMTLRVWHERDSGRAGGRSQAVVLITPGFMTLGVWHEQDSGIAGGRKFWQFSQTRELNVIKSEERYPILVSKRGVPSETRDFCNA